MSRLEEMLIRHEASKTHAYKCSADKTTVGVGRNIDPDGGLGLSQDEITFLLRNDIERVKQELTDNFDWFRDLDSVRADAMIDLCFNIGITSLRKFSKSLALMESGDYMPAADEFLDSRWAAQVGRRSIEITNMIRSGEYQNAAA